MSPKGAVISQQRSIFKKWAFKSDQQIYIKFKEVFKRYFELVLAQVTQSYVYDNLL